MKEKVYFIILLFIFGCSNQNTDRFWFLNKDKDFEKVSELFYDYIDFFPEKGHLECINYSWSLNAEKEYNIKAVFEFDDGYFIKENNKLASRSIAKYKVTDTCLFVLNRFSTHQNYGYPDDSEINYHLIDRACLSEMLPVPNFSNFSEFQSELTICKLNEDFTLYVLDAKSGRFLKEKDLTEGNYMPHNWKNGYSKGVAISEERKIIIYWVIIW